MKIRGENFPINWLEQFEEVASIWPWKKGKKRCNEGERAFFPLPFKTEFFFFHRKKRKKQGEQTSIPNQTDIQSTVGTSFFFYRK